MFAVLPKLTSVLYALAKDFCLLVNSGLYTLAEGMFGLVISVTLGYLTAVAMDSCAFIKKILYPFLVLSQAVPYIAVAPLLILCFGYGMAPKVIIIAVTCFFPIAVGVNDGLQNIPCEYTDELKIAGGNYVQSFVFVKAWLTLPHFFSALKIAVSYSFVSAVTSEWIGGNKGIGVYMTRVKKSYEFDKFFAAILLVIVVSLSLVALIRAIESRAIKNVI